MPPADDSPLVTDLDALPQLRALLWSRVEPAVSERDAFVLYETERAWVHPREMSAHERAFLAYLTERYGHGVFLG